MKITRTQRWLLCGGVVGLAVGSATTSTIRAEEENEVKMKIDQVPAAVKETILKEADGVTVTDLDKENDDGKTIYEADAKIGKHNYEIKVTEDGTLISKKLDEDDHEKGEKKDKD